ncbi:MAG TPA: Gfo/Idh/MocA family oxidoreductase [Bacteroidales bacterium]|nr:Gfo/Idh/MocA family oxidoreductase [Bacteroidales bacterium]
MKKTAVVGFGFMGMTHALNILKIKGLQLSAIVERDLSLIDRNLGSGIGNIATGSVSESSISNAGRYTDLDDCLKSEDLDAVIICTHVNSHFELARKALLNKKSVFIEKPFCLSLAEAAELISIAGSAKKLLMVGHVVRFMAPYMQLKRWIDSKEFGELKFLTFSRFCGLPGWGQWKEKNVRDLSGGALFDLVIHDIDYAVSVAGKPESINSTCLPGEYSNHDYVSALWKYKDIDLTVKIEGGFTYHKAYPFNAGFTARFEQASLIYSTLAGDVIRIADNNSVREVPSGDAGAGYYNEMEYFAECLNRGEEPLLCSPQSSLEAIELCYKHI